MGADRRELIAIFAGGAVGAVANLAVSLALGLACAWAGRELGAAL